jgi:GTP-binding protein EngB required for normal cell division
MTAVGQQHRDAQGRPCSPELVKALEQARGLLATSVSADSPLMARIAGLRDRLAGERLQLAVLGQFKRGKSTFLNALLGAPLLPTGVVPLTAVATFISWGPSPLVRVHFNGRKAPEAFPLRDPDAIRDCLFRFVAEEANPNNALDVARVELLLPAPILANGTVLIDTPGVGSTLSHNTEAAHRVLPECDAALFVLSADPPITEIELDYLRAVQTKTARVFYVLNKIDYLAGGEQRSAVDFLRKVLMDKELIEQTDPIFCVSARQGLAAKASSSHCGLDRSGIAAVEEHLIRYLATEKARSLEDAIRRKTAEVVAAGAAEAELRARALEMPLDQLASKSAAFERALRSIEEQRRVTADLLAGDKRRLRDNLESAMDVLRAGACAKLHAAVDGSLAGPVPATWQASTQKAVAAAIDEVFDAARGELSSAVGADTVAALSAHQDRIDALIEQVRHTAARAFDVALPRGSSREPFQLGQDPYWVTDRLGASLIPDVGRLLDRLLPLSLRRRRMRARLARQADELVVRNAENLRWAIVRGLDDTFRGAAARLDERLGQAISATRGVIKDALARRQDQSFAVRPEIEHLASARSALAALLRGLTDRSGDEVDADVPPSAAGRRR